MKTLKALALMTTLTTGIAFAETVTFDGKPVIETTDDSFSEAGKVGLWTKADSVTLFDDFTFGNQ